MRHVWVLMLVLTLVAACSGKSEADKAGDPLPNAKAGLEALYKGDLNGLNRYFCQEIILSLRAQIADEAAEKGGKVDLSQASFEVSGKLREDYLYVRMTGEYAIWLGDLVDVYDTTASGPILLLMEARDGVWQICDIQTETTSTPEGN